MPPIFVAGCKPASTMVARERAGDAMRRCNSFQLEPLEARALFSASAAGLTDTFFMTPALSAPTSELVASPVTPTPTPLPTPQPLVPGVLSFSLVAAATGEAVSGYAALSDGAVIDIDTLPPDLPLSVGVNLGAALLPAASVRYAIDGVSGMDNAAPFSGPASWTPTVGGHVVVAAAYSG